MFLLRKPKLQLETVHLSWRSVDEAIKRVSTIITDHEHSLTQIKRASGEGLQGIRHEYQHLEIFKKSLDNQDKEIQQITSNSSTLKNHDEVQSRIKDLKHLWQTLNATVQETMKNLKYMLSVHGDFQLTQDSLALWLTDLDVLLTNLEHLSEAPVNDKIRQLDDIDREIQEKQTKIEYVQTCAHYLLNKTVDARGLTINMNQLSKFCRQLRDLTARIHKLKQNLVHSTDGRTQIYVKGVRDSISPSVRSYDHRELDDRRQRADELLADFDDLLLQIKADFTSKEQNLHSSTPVGVQTENLPIDFSYNQLLISTRRKIDALQELIRQSQQESGSFLSQDLAVQDVMKKWNYLQILANEKDDQLQQHRQQWIDFRRQLDHLEHLSSRTWPSNSDVHPRLDEVASLLKITSELADDFSDDSKEWILIEHRLQSIKEKLHFPTHRSSSKLKPDLREELLEINSQLDHLESLTHSLEPVDDYEINANANRTKLHRFIRIHDDLEIVNDRLLHLNDHNRMNNDLKILADRLNTIKRLVRIYLEQLEKLLAQHEFNQSFSLSKHSPLRSSNNSLHRVHQ